MRHVASGTAMQPSREITLADLSCRQPSRRARNCHGQLDGKHQRDHDGGKFGHGVQFTLTQRKSRDPPEWQKQGTAGRLAQRPISAGRSQERAVNNASNAFRGAIDAARAMRRILVGSV